ncbi:elongation factor G [Treponema sp. OMZ 840]|uniref:elongation factor G n=1 Tax=Treponema sp. OMZ 840 TaxID=244313 RepID=UPI003D904F61
MDFKTNQIRNITVAGHGQTGKTTFFERLLFAGGVLAKPENVESGKTVSDNSAEEIERKISIYASLAHITWKDVNINIWDTPGSSDFAGEVISAFRSTESALMLIDGRSGAQIETIKLWRDLDRRNKPRMVFINRCEEDRTDIDAVLKDIREKFKAEVCPVTIPMGKGASYKGVIDVLHGKAYSVPAAGQKESVSDIPDAYRNDYEEARAVLAGAAAEGDDDLLVKFIDDGELTNEEIERGLKIALQNNRVVPAFAGSTVQNSGFGALLDFIVEIVPDPAQALETALAAEGETSAVKICPDGNMSALVIKTSSDQFSGRLSYIKVITGTFNADTEVFNIAEGRKEKVGKIYRCTGKKLEEVKSLCAGDIGIAVKLALTRTSDTLASDANTLPFVRLRHPEPVFSMAVSAKEKRDEDKMSEMLSRISEEDRTLTYKYNAETKQNVVSGMGELHINIILDKIKAQAKINIDTAVPRVAYRETVQRKAQAEYTHKKQSGGHGQYARVVLSVEALPRGENYKFTNAVFGGAISKGYIPGVEKGVKEAMENGVLAGYPVVDASITVLDGKEHPVDSSEMAFKIAARNAFRDAMRAAGPILLEPIMNITVWVESKYLGDIMSDLSGKRGRILGQSPLGGGIEEIRAQAPQAELLKYAIDLRSMTSGTGSFETSFDHYDPISGKIADDVIAAAKEFITIASGDD